MKQCRILPRNTQECLVQLPNIAGNFGVGYPPNPIAARTAQPADCMAEIGAFIEDVLKMSVFTRSPEDLDFRHVQVINMPYDLAMPIQLFLVVSALPAVSACQPGNILGHRTPQQCSSRAFGGLQPEVPMSKRAKHQIREIMLQCLGLLQTGPFFQYVGDLLGVKSACLNDLELH